MTEKEELEFEMRPEYDFSNGQPNPYASRARTGTNLVLIEPDLFELFPSSDAVNEALRLIVNAAALVTKGQAGEQGNTK